MKVLDFGLAKLTEGRLFDEDAPTETVEARTEEGTIVGTVAYMSPEQADGKPVDARSDVFSLGAVLYELVSGRRPFQRESHVSTLAAIVRDAPDPLRTLRRDAPPELERVITRCLDKDRDRRFASGGELRDALERCRRIVAAGSHGLVHRLGRPRVALAIGAAVVAVVALFAWVRTRGADERWARETALPDIARLVEAEQYSDALRLARRAEPHLADDTELRQLVRNISLTAAVRSERGVRGLRGQGLADRLPLVPGGTGARQLLRHPATQQFRR